MNRHTCTAPKRARLAASLGSALLTLLVAHPILADPFDATPDDNVALAATQGGLMGAHEGGFIIGLSAPAQAGVAFEMAALAADLALKNTPPVLELPDDLYVSPNAVGAGDTGMFQCDYRFGSSVRKDQDVEGDNYEFGVEESFASVHYIPYDPLDSVFGDLGTPAVYHPQADVRVRAINPYLGRRNSPDFDSQTIEQLQRRPEFPIGRHEIRWEANTSMNLIMDFTVPSLLIPVGIGAEHYLAKRIAAKNARAAILLGVDIASEAGLIAADVTGAAAKLQWYEDTLFFTAANRATQTLTVWDIYLPYFRDLRTNASHIDEQVIELEATDFGGVRLGRVEADLRAAFEAVDNCGRRFDIVTDSPSSRLFTIGNGPHDLVWQAREINGGPYNPDDFIRPNQEREGDNLVTFLTQRISVVDSQAPLLLPPAGFARETTTDLDLTAEPFPLGRPRVADLADPAPQVTNDAPTSLAAPDGSDPSITGLRYAIHWLATDNQGNVTVAAPETPEQYTQIVTLKVPGSNTVPQAIGARDGDSLATASEPVEIVLLATDADKHCMATDADCLAGRSAGRPDPLDFKIDAYPQAGQFEIPALPFFIDDFRLTPAGEREESDTLTRTSPLRHLADDFRLADPQDRGIFLNDNICNADPNSENGMAFGGVIPIDFVYRPSYVYVDDQNNYYIRDSFWVCGEGENGNARPDAEPVLSSIPRISKWTDAGELLAMRSLYPTVDPAYDNSNLDPDFWPDDRFYVDHEDRIWSTSYNDFVAKNGAPVFRKYFSFDQDLADMRLHGEIAYRIDENPFVSGIATDSRAGVLYEINNLSYRTPHFQYRTNWITARRYGEDLQADDPANKIGEIRPDYTLGPMNASSIAVDSEGYIYAGDRFKHRIYKFSPSVMNAAGEWELGEFIGWMGRCTANRLNDDGVPYSACDEANQVSYGYACDDARCVGYRDDPGQLLPVPLEGDQPGQFNEPASIAIDPNDILYVADFANFRVQRFGPDGTFAGEAQSTGSGVNQGDEPGFIIGNMGKPGIVTVNSSSFFVMEEDPQNGDFFVHSFKSTPFYDVTDSSAKIRYVSNFDFLPQDSFSYVVDDGIAESAPAAVNVFVTRAFTAPERLAAACYADTSLASDVPCTLDEDSEIYIRLSAYDPDGFISTGGQDSLTFELLEDTQHGSLTAVSATDNARLFRYSPVANFNGSDSLRFRAFDGRLYSEADAAVSLTVSPVPDAVTIDFDDDIVVARGFPSVIMAEFSDVDEDPDVQASLVSIDWGDGNGATAAGNWSGSGREDLNGREISPQIDYGRGRGVIVGSHVYDDVGLTTVTATMNPAPEEAVGPTVAAADVQVVATTVVGAGLVQPDADITPDQPFPLVIDIENFAPADGVGQVAGSVTVAFDVPEGLALVPVSPGCSGTARISCTLGDLGSGEASAITFTGLVSRAAAEVRADYELLLTLTDTGRHLPDENVASLGFKVADRDSDGTFDDVDAFPDDPQYQVDTDGDGLPDSWESDHGFDPNVADDVAADSDGDGFTLQEEFANGSSPLLAENETNVAGDRLESPDNTVEDRFGLAMAGGDLNGDGIDDLVIGASTYATNGAAFIAWGTAQGVSTSLTQLAPQNGEVNFARVLAVGDWDDNGMPDLAIAAQDTIAIHWNNGEIFAVPDLYLSAANAGGLALLSADLDGDAVEDLVVKTQVDTGDTRIDVYASTLGGIDAAPQTLLAAGQSFVGQSIGDVDGDGRLDLLLGSPGGGFVRAFLGADNDWTSAGALVASFDVPAVAGQSSFGWALAANGDVTGDGIDDLVVGAYSSGGFVNLYNSESAYRDVPGTPPMQVIAGTPAGTDTHGDQLGVSMAVADLDADGFADFVVGANRAGLLDEGQVRILHGSAAGFVGEQLENGTTAYDLLGHNVAVPGDLDGDGFADVAGGASDVHTAQNPTPDGGYVQLWYHRFAAANAGDDIDDDGVAAAVDNCPEHANTNQSDIDGDGAGDACDTDIDGDGIGNSADNCPRDASLDQTDSDGDLDGDLCDADDDNDNVADVDDAFPYNPAYSADTDSDGMPDSWETDNGLDPNDATDATADLDGDGRNNLAEFEQGGDVAQDDVAPVLTPPGDITVNAIGPLTPVATGAASATDALDGDVPASSDRPDAFPPGRNLVTWRASDAAGNESASLQRVDVVPLVGFNGNAMDLPESGAATLFVRLNGNAVNYPVEVPFTVTGTATSGSDYTIATGDLVIDNRNVVPIDVSALADGVADDGETIVIRLGTPVNAVAGPNSEFVVTIHESNLPPLPDILAEQGGALVTTVTQDGGDVVLTANPADPEDSDTHVFDWSATDNALTPQEGDAQATFTFAPAAVSPGVYRVEVAITDSGSPAQTVRQHRYVRVIPATPAYLAGADSDGDGIEDAAEGLRDSNGNGASDYLDPSDESHLLLSRTGGNGYLQAQQGYTLSLGRVALTTGDDAMVSMMDVTDYGDRGGQAANGNDTQFSYPAGIYDFEVSQLPRAGHSALVVIPQTAPLPGGGAYRKYVDGQGWGDFVQDAGNAVFSAAGAAASPGVCPAPGSADYQPGLTAGYLCVQLLIVDGGPNDADGLANRSIRDPGGVAIAAVAAAVGAQGIQVADKSVAAGATNVVMLRFTLDSNTSDTVLNELALDASGTGNDRADISAVKLWVDANANGVVDAGDTEVGAGTYPADDGRLVLEMATPLILDAGTTDFIISYDF